MHVIASRARFVSIPALIVALMHITGAMAGAQPADLVVSDAWARMAPNKRNGAAFMTIQNPRATGVSIVRAESPAARVIELHEMAMQGDVMRMRRIERIDIAAGARVELKPGGFHVMLIDLVKPLAPGDSVALTLHLADGSTLEVSAAVRAMGMH